MGYWPAAPNNVTTVFDQELFEFWDILQKLSPGVSERSFLLSLQEFSLNKGRVSICLIDVHPATLINSNSRNITCLHVHVTYIRVHASHCKGSYTTPITWFWHILLSTIKKLFSIWVSKWYPMSPSTPQPLMWVFHILI